jgi:hypothetical protein
VPSTAKVLVADVRDVTCAKATDVACANTPNASSAEAADVASAEATHMASAKATHVASAKTAATAMAATAAATRFGASSQQAAGEHRARQNHHRSSSHDILLWNGRTIRHWSSQTPACPREANADVVIDSRWAGLSSVSTKFAFIRLEAGSLLAACGTPPVRFADQLAQPSFAAVDAQLFQKDRTTHAHLVQGGGT